jgi:hypothetical protein
VKAGILATAARVFQSTDQELAAVFGALEQSTEVYTGYYQNTNVAPATPDNIVIPPSLAPGKITSPGGGVPDEGGEGDGIPDYVPPEWSNPEVPFEPFVPVP